MLNAKLLNYWHSILPAGLPLIPTLGNNDVFHHNQLAFHPTRPHDELDFYANLWKELLPSSQRSVFRMGGYFFRDVLQGKLRIVSLNTMYWFRDNKLVNDCHSEESAGSVQLEWVDSVVQDAKQHGLPVYLMGHIPPRYQYMKPYV
jgi:endopolyphosphatase